MASERLLVDFKRTGGVAGVRLGTSVDADELPPEEADELRRLVGKLDLEGTTHRPARRTGKPDRFVYDLAIQKGEHRYEFTTGDGEATPDLREFLDKMTSLARRR